MTKDFTFIHQHTPAGNGWADEEFLINCRNSDTSDALLKLRMFIDSRWLNFRTDRETSENTAFIGVVLSGSQLRGEMLLHSGDVVIEHRRNQPLVSRSFGENELHRLVMIVSRTSAFDLLIPALFPENTTIIRQGASEKVLELFREIRLMAETGKSDMELSIRLFTLLQELSAISRSVSGDPVLAKALEFIRRHGCQPLSREEIARASGVSVRTLSNLFSRHLGCGVAEYLSRKRLQLAGELLASGKLSVKETARISGFASTEFFIRAFRKSAGVSPGRYIKDCSNHLPDNGKAPHLQ